MINVKHDELKKLPLDCLVPGQYQPRHEFDELAIQALAESIKQVGILQNLIVRPKGEGKYEIIAGERRWRAANLVGLEMVPCVIKDIADEDAAQIALIENLSRENLSWIDEAKAIARLIHEFQLTHEEVAQRLQRSREDITNTVRLLKLESRVRTLLTQGKITKSHGKVLLSLPLEQQYFYAREAAARNWSVATLERNLQTDQHLPAKTQHKTDTNIGFLAQRLSEHLAHEVQIEADKANKGWVKIKFNHLDEFDSILAKLGYQLDE